MTAKDENGRQVIYQCYLVWCSHEDRTESAVREHIREAHKDLLNASKPPTRP